MDLPIASESYQPSLESLIRQVKRGYLMLARAVAEESHLDVALAEVRPGLPDDPRLGRLTDGWLGRCALDVTTCEGTRADEVVDRVEGFFQEQQAPCLGWLGAGEQADPALREALIGRGYEAVEVSVLRLNQRKPVAPSGQAAQIIPARAAYGEYRRLLREAYAEQLAAMPTPDDHPADPDALLEAVTELAVDIQDEPRMEVLLGRLNRQTVGCCGVLTVGEIGLIHYPYVGLRWRGQGLGRVLLGAVLDLCERASYRTVLAEVEPGQERLSALYRGAGFSRAGSYEWFRGSAA